MLIIDLLVINGGSGLSAASVGHERRGHIPSTNENHVAPKKEGKGEGALVPRAPRQHLCGSPDNELREQRGD
jgi:hypothetical protein